MTVRMRPIVQNGAGARGPANKAEIEWTPTNSTTNRPGWGVSTLPDARFYAWRLGESSASPVLLVMLVPDNS